MARVTKGIGQAFSGRLDNIVFVNKGDITYVRTLPRERKPSEWSADQIQHRKCFAIVMRYASRMMNSFVRPIWNKSATDTISGFNLFVKANKPAFGTKGRVEDPCLLRFSAGSLPLPSNLKVVMSSEVANVIIVRWKNEIANPVRGQDHLMVVFYSQNELMKPIETAFMRKDEQAQLVLPEKTSNEIFLYLFFGSADQTAYSNDHAFKIAIN